MLDNIIRISIIFLIILSVFYIIEPTNCITVSAFLTAVVFIFLKTTSSPNKTKFYIKKKPADWESIVIVAIFILLGLCGISLERTINVLSGVIAGFIIIAILFAVNSKIRQRKPIK